MDRRKTRYWLFRFQTEAGGGALATDAPEGLRESYEDQQIFKFCGGWRTFGVSWDLTENTPFTIVAIKESLWAAWDKHCASVAKEIPKAVIEKIEVERPEFIENEEVDVNLVMD